ncbi:hypothetical protein L873DRAFT_1383219 [Choiromyces venosus 120613-1]|uniref:Uncharacterized protein n=1 Tax=Choiromyces venosus 120613-1 TaxID=1336337 RepID=A0A3N4J9W2_9PEZI|nr:hypothetical protein L873DRAFT_1383219 [Choiromyces venosus 120613-1]
MAPLPVPAADATGALDSIMSTISSLFKPKPSFPPIYPPYPKPEEAPTSPSRAPSPPPPGKFTLESPGPEKEAWWKTPGLAGTNEYAELMANPWKDNRRRSVPEFHVMAINRTHVIRAEQQQQPEVEYPLTVGEGVSLVAMAWTATILMWVCIVYFMVTFERKLSAVLEHRGIGTEKEGKYRRLYLAGYLSTIISIWIICGCCILCIRDLFLVTSFGAF